MLWHPVQFDGAKLEGEVLPPDGWWLEWMFSDGHTEVARLKYDTMDHFYPFSKTLNIEKAIAWRHRLDTASELATKFETDMQAILDKHKNHPTIIFDEELCHQDMDDAMCALLKQLGFEKGVKIFEDTPKWYA